MKIQTVYWHRIVLAAYLLIGVLFAVNTPAWQAPDEPAHYNYVHFVATQGALPVLQAGDYDQAQQMLAINSRFGPGSSITAFRYEFHQPPLYYVLAAPLFRLTSGALLPLRLFSVFLGALLLLVVHRVARLIVRPALAVGAMAFVAFLPMHIAMASAVNNDSLAELLMVVMLWQCLHVILHPPRHSLRPWFGLGLITGLGLVTKSTVYGLLPMLGVTLILAWRDSLQHDPSARHASRITFALLLPLLLLAVPWWLRNLAVYGGTDFLGLNRHEDIVLGQLRTAEFVAQQGWTSLGTRFVTWTFRSFWGQFGWMSVLLDDRIYTALLTLSAAVSVGALWTLRRVWRQNNQAVRRALLLLGLAALGAVGGYLWYNLSFVQHQGRYLFPALLTFGLGWAVGLAALAQPGVSRTAAAVAVAGGLLTLALAPGRWTLLLWAAAAGLLFLLPRLPRWHSLLYAAVFVGLAGLDIVSLFWFIVPQLRP